MQAVIGLDLDDPDKTITAKLYNTEAEAIAGAMDLVLEHYDEDMYYVKRLEAIMGDTPEIFKQGYVSRA